MSKKLHSKACTGTYANTSIRRGEVPSDKISFATPFPNYHPVDYTADFVKSGPVWADPANPSVLKFNTIDGATDRTSFVGYSVENGFPQNPIGRTGVTGRGNLGKWGPNHAADPILSSWKRDECGEKVYDPISRRPILRFVAIFRKKDSEWAIPGGMCDPGENISQTLKREFAEEALNSNDYPERKEIAENIFKKGIKIYQGYVDDPRNTDNAWMETQAYNFHDEIGKLDFVKLEAGDDAAAVKWTDISSDLALYASHKDFIEKVAKLHDAHW
ncbi:Oidioi.mRNA.OKI2018_I69.chr2.g7558.t1.cds [Oikopleura dioica]|uniref:Oidioi.mRNA.OKI2018_I69.chr2.g7558.t1.cds n=1 Tax=Oikopleura dioica TaxID=34765 RepID=A0ABN7TCG9_OIKDI|nr:Oidioi.mRNA.OKI2018_I69.chr2.g7558.t1.cds [Oikopleura dioica]